MTTSDPGAGDARRRAASRPAGDAAAADAARAHDRRRLRAALRLVAAGALLGALGAGVLAALGAPGASGLVAVLLGLVVGCVVAAVHLAACSLVDEARGRPVSLRRPAWSLGLFVMAGLLLLVVGGATRS